MEFTQEFDDGCAVLFANGAPFGMMKRGQFIGTSKESITLFRAYLNSIPCAPDKMTEYEFRDQVAHDLERDGWDVMKEVYIGCGRVDILAEREGKTRIVEVKLAADHHTCSHALGQLLFYQQELPHADMYFASAEEPTDDVVITLNSNGVNYFGR